MSDAANPTFFVGTYTRSSSRGIYAVSLDPRTGSLAPPSLAAEAPNPTFIALSPGGEFLYAVCAGRAWASSFRVGPGCRLAPVQQADADASATPCHIAVDRSGRVALAANYHLALAAVMTLGSDGSIGVPHAVAHAGHGTDPKRQATAHVHSSNFSPDGRFALVCDLGLDRVYTYAIEREGPRLLPGDPPFAATAPASGPRHLTFAADGLTAFLISELANTITVYGFDPARGSLAQRQVVSVLPEGYAGEATAAEVAVHPNGRFVYGSSRGPDTIAVFEFSGGTLRPVEVVPCGGKGPRGFGLSRDGAWLVCAHQDSDTLCAFAVDGGTGRLRRIPGTVAVPMPVCVVAAR